MGWLRRFLTAGRARWIVAGIVGAATVGLLALNAADPAPPDLDELERAGRAGDKAQTQSERITDNLERIAENLEAGANLSESSEEIHALTEKQQRSLADLADLLRGQLESIQRTGQQLEESQESAESVERIGRIETQRIKETLASLRILEAATQQAVERSADLARQAIYGARLAEDSAESFSRP
jgi:hypothetical protein